MREKILLVFFEKGTFPYKGNVFKIKEKKSEEESEEEIKDDHKKFIEYIENESKGINYSLSKDYFNFVVPSALAKNLCEIKNKNKSNKLLNVTKSELSDLKDKIKEMSEYEKKNWTTG